MKKILLSVAIIGFLGAVAVGGTGAFFSDTETSSGNTFTAGAIDLMLKNTSYVTNAAGTLVASAATTWGYDTQNGLFFNFNDVKPGDVGEDTIGLKVASNDSWVCGKVTVTEDSDNTCNEPENAADAENNACFAGTGAGVTTGELAENMQMIWWADDGDNVLEDNEPVITNANLGDAPIGTPVKITLADSSNNVWTGSGPMVGNREYFIGKGWCVGSLTLAPVTQDDTNTSGPLTRGTGFTCSGAQVGNSAQTDQVKLDVKFDAVQSRNNAQFTCGGVNLPIATVVSGTGWSPIDSTPDNDGVNGKWEWLSKIRNNNGGFEMQIGTSDSISGQQNTADTTWVAGQTESFTLTYNGAGQATLSVASHPSVTYPVGSVGTLARLGITVKAPASVTTTVDALALSVVGPLSDDDVTVTGGTNHLLITGANLNQAWTLTGTFVFSAVGSGTGFSAENPAVQFSID